MTAEELPDAAYYEVGHKTFYEHLGGAGDAVVRRNESKNPDEKTWLGQFRPRMCPEAVRLPREELVIAQEQGRVSN